MRQLEKAPNEFKHEFDGNKLKESSAKWCRCDVDRNDCPDRQGVSSFGKPPACEQCEVPLVPDRTHYHLVEKTLATKLCEECWSKDPLPQGDESTKFRFLTDPNYR